MQVTTIRRRLGGVVAIVATTATLSTTLVTHATAATTTPTTRGAAQAAAGWLARQLVGPRHDHYAVTFGTTSFPDAGETADGVLAMDAYLFGEPR